MTTSKTKQQPSNRRPSYPVTFAAILATVGAIEAMVFVSSSHNTVTIADAPPPVIGNTPSVTRPPIDAPAQPPGTVSQGPAETGPHGQVDITKPMTPAAPSSLPRTAPDRPIKPQ